MRRAVLTAVAMKKGILAGPGATALLLVVAVMMTAAHAGAPGAVRVSIVSARAALRDRVVAAPEHYLPGIVQTLQLPDGGQFLVVDFALQAEWGGDERSATIRTDQITLTAADGRAGTYVGRLTPTGHFRPHNSLALYIHESHGKDDVDKPHRFNAVFTVPKGTKGATLKVGEATCRVGPRPPVAFPEPGEFATFHVVGARFVDAATGKHSFGHNKPEANRIVSPAVGRLLAVKLAITPKRSNVERGDHFSLNTWDVALTFGKGVCVPAAGQLHGAFGYDTCVLMSNYPNADGSWDTKVYTIYFAVPQDLTDFAVTYLAAPMAKGTVGR